MMLQKFCPGAAISYPQLEEPCFASFNRFYDRLAQAALEFARHARDEDSRSFYRMQCTLVQTAENAITVTVSLSHRLPQTTTRHRTFSQVWRDGLLCACEL